MMIVHLFYLCFVCFLARHRRHPRGKKKERIRVLCVLQIRSRKVPEETHCKISFEEGDMRNTGSKSQHNWSSVT